MLLECSPASGPARPTGDRERDTTSSAGPGAPGMSVRCGIDEGRIASRRRILTRHRLRVDKASARVIADAADIAQGRIADGREWMRCRLVPLGQWIVSDLSPIGTVNRRAFAPRLAWCNGRGIVQVGMAAPRLASATLSIAAVTLSHGADQFKIVFPAGRAAVR